MSLVVKIIAENSCPSDCAEFLTNYANKQRFVNVLAEALELNGFETVLCPSDADTKIMRTALENLSEQVTILADDADIFCLLLHHLFFPTVKKIYLNNMGVENSKDEIICYNIQDVIATNPKEHLEHLLFLMDLLGVTQHCRFTTLGEKSIFGKLKKSSGLQETFKTFYSNNVTVSEIGNAAPQFFELLHSPTFALLKIRKQKYDATFVSDRSKIDPALLPPSPRAAFYHGLRGYDQINVWKDLSDVDKGPLHWDWKLSSNKYVPIITDAEAGLLELLKIIQCGCNGSCVAKCSCRKAGLKCTSTCKECHGITCTNILENEPEENHMNLQKCFLDVFEIY